MTYGYCFREVLLRVVEAEETPKKIPSQGLDVGQDVFEFEFGFVGLEALQAITVFE